MARTPEQRGPFGRWLVGERRARGWSADEMRARVQEARGFAMAHSTYALLESGQRQPTDEQRRHLTAFLGSEPAAEAPAPTPDLAALIAALTEQSRQQAQLIALLTEQNAMLKRWLAPDWAPAADAGVPSARGAGPLPPSGIGRAVRGIAELDSAPAPVADPSSAPGTAAGRRGTR